MAEVWLGRHERPIYLLTRNIDDSRMHLDLPIVAPDEMLADYERVMAEFNSLQERLAEIHLRALQWKAGVISQAAAARAKRVRR